MAEVKNRRIIIYLENSLMELVDKHCGSVGAQASGYAHELIVRDLARRGILRAEHMVEMLASPNGLVTTRG